MTLELSLKNKSLVVLVHYGRDSMLLEELLAISDKIATHTLQIENVVINKKYSHHRKTFPLKISTRIPHQKYPYHCHN